MKKLFLAVLFALILASCSKDPLGIEDNVIAVPIGNGDFVADTTTPQGEPKTKFLADSVRLTLRELFVRKIDTLSIPWGAEVSAGKAAIDTASRPFVLDAFISARRKRDSTPAPLFAYQYINAFEAILSKIEIKGAYRLERNLSAIKTSLTVVRKMPRQAVTFYGEYFFSLSFKEPFIRGDYLWISAEIKFNAPNLYRMKKLEDILAGTLEIRFPLK